MCVNGLLVGVPDFDRLRQEPGLTLCFRAFGFSALKTFILCGGSTLHQSGGRTSSNIHITIKIAPERFLGVHPVCWVASPRRGLALTK